MRQNTKVPEFATLEEEKKYWESRGPLAEGRKGRVNKPKPGQKRSSFLVVRLTGEELTRLRDVASKQGLGPSTFARLVLTAVIKHQPELPKRSMTLEQLKNALEENLPQSVKESAEDMVKALSIGNPPFLLEINKPATEEGEQFVLRFISSILAMAGVEVITTKGAEDQKPKPMAEKFAL